MSQPLSRENTLHEFGALLALSLAAACASAAAPRATASPSPVLASTYDPLKTFAPLTLPDPVNRLRSGSGAPGPDCAGDGP